MIEIKQLYGYTLDYDERRKVFVINNAEGEELAIGKTQDEAEARAKMLSKNKFKRIRIVKVDSEGVTIMGELTSLNRDDGSAWVSLVKGEDTYGSGRQKITLRYSRSYYEATESNLKVIENIQKERLILKQCFKVISDLIETLEKPINSAYFGITQ